MGILKWEGPACRRPHIGPCVLELSQKLNGIWIFESHAVIGFLQPNTMIGKMTSAQTNDPKTEI